MYGKTALLNFAVMHSLYPHAINCYKALTIFSILEVLRTDSCFHPQIRYKFKALNRTVPPLRYLVCVLNGKLSVSAYIEIDFLATIFRSTCWCYYWTFWYKYKRVRVTNIIAMYWWRLNRKQFFNPQFDPFSIATLHISPECVLYLYILGRGGVSLLSITAPQVERKASHVQGVGCS